MRSTSKRICMYIHAIKHKWVISLKWDISLKWVISRVNESCHTSSTYKWVKSHTDESNHIQMSEITYEWVKRHTDEWNHIWMSQITYKWVKSHTNESNDIQMSEITYEWVKSHGIICDESCHIYEWVASLTTYMSHMSELIPSHVTYVLGFPQRKVHREGPLRIFRNQSGEHWCLEKTTARWPGERRGRSHSE